MDAEANKTEKKSISFPVGMLTDAQAYADEHNHGNLSAFIQTLVKKALTGQMKSDARDPLVVLARLYHPGLADEMKQLCYEADGSTPRIPQNKLLGRLLEATALALRAQREVETEMAAAPKNAIQAEMSRLRQIEDSFFQIAATITAYGERRRQDLHAAEHPPVISGAKLAAPAAASAAAIADYAGPSVDDLRRGQEKRRGRKLIAGGDPKADTRSKTPQP